METPSDKDADITLDKLRLKKDMIELVADQIYVKMTKLFNDIRERFEIEDKITVEPKYKSFSQDDNGNLTFIHKNEVIALGNIDEGLISPSKISGIRCAKTEVLEI